MVRSGLKVVGESSRSPRRPAASVQITAAQCETFDEKSTLGTLRQEAKGALGAAGEDQHVAIARCIVKRQDGVKLKCLAATSEECLH